MPRFDLNAMNADELAEAISNLKPLPSWSPERAAAIERDVLEVKIMRNRQTVTVTLDIVLDPADWDMNYGTGTDAIEVRDDVRTYVSNAVHEQLKASGITSARVELRP